LMMGRGSCCVDDAFKMEDYARATIEEPS